MIRFPSEASIFLDCLLDPNLPSNGLDANRSKKKTGEKISEYENRKHSNYTLQGNYDRESLQGFFLRQARQFSHHPKATVIHPGYGLGPAAYGQSQIDGVNTEPLTNQTADYSNGGDHGDRGASLGNADCGSSEKSEQQNSNRSKVITSGEGSNVQT